MTSAGKRTKNSARTNMARYSNYFEIGHNSYEFLIDFGQFQPEAENVLLHTRIIFGPTHAKLLENMLRDSVQRYEAENGVIPKAPDSASSRTPE